MVQTSRETARSGGIRRLNEPRSVEVQTDDIGLPVSIRERTKPIGVATIEDHWMVRDRWWREKSVERTYYEVILEDGQHVIIYLDELTGSWYRIRGY